MTGEEGSGAVWTCASNTVTVAGAADAAKGKATSAMAIHEVLQRRMAVFRGNGRPLSREYASESRPTTFQHGTPTEDSPVAPTNPRARPRWPKARRHPAWVHRHRHVSGPGTSPAGSAPLAGEYSGPSRLVHHLTIRESEVRRSVAVTHEAWIETSSSPASPLAVGRLPPCTHPGEEHRGRPAFPEDHRQADSAPRPVAEERTARVRV